MPIRCRKILRRPPTIRPRITKRVAPNEDAVPVPQEKLFLKLIFWTFVIILSCLLGKTLPDFEFNQISSIHEESKVEINCKDYFDGEYCVMEENNILAVVLPDDDKFVEEQKNGHIQEEVKKAKVQEEVEVFVEVVWEQQKANVDEEKRIIEVKEAKVEEEEDDFAEFDSIFKEELSDKNKMQEEKKQEKSKVFVKMTEDDFAEFKPVFNEDASKDKEMREKATEEEFVEIVSDLIAESSSENGSEKLESVEPENSAEIENEEEPDIGFLYGYGKTICLTLFSIFCFLLVRCIFFRRFSIIIIKPPKVEGSMIWDDTISNVRIYDIKRICEMCGKSFSREFEEIGNDEKNYFRCDVCLASSTHNRKNLRMKRHIEQYVGEKHGIPWAFYLKCVLSLVFVAWLIIFINEGCSWTAFWKEVTTITGRSSEEDTLEIYKKTAKNVLYLK